MTSKKHSIPRSWFIRISIDSLIVLGISVALVLLAEGFLATFFPQNLSGKRIDGKTFSNHDDVLGVRYTPGAIWQFTHPEYSVEYAINQHGFRDEKLHPIPKPAGIIRVLVVGDSFTFGHGVDYEESWPVLVEKKLDALGHTHIDLVKAGMQGMDTRSEYMLIQRLLDEYQYDVVVVGFLINDLYFNSLAGLEGSEDLAKPGGETADAPSKQGESINAWSAVAKRVFIRNDRSWSFHLLTLAKRWVISIPAVYCKFYFSGSRGDFLTIPLPQEPEEKLKITASLFEKMAAFLMSKGKKLIVLSIPQQAQVLCADRMVDSSGIDLSYYDRYFASLSNRRGFVWLSTLQAFNESQYPRDELFYRFDGHLTPLGNQLVADFFVAELLSHINRNKLY